MNCTMAANGWNAYRDGIVIPGLATVRLPDDEGQYKIRNTDRRTRWRRELAIAAGITTWQFKKLSDLDRAAVRYALNAMTSPTHCGMEPDPIDWNGFAEAWHAGRVR